MIKKEEAFYTYPVLFILTFAYHAFSLPLLRYLVPIYLVTVPFALQKKVNLRFSLRDLLAGIMASAVILVPFWYLMSFAGKRFVLLPVSTMLFQLFAVSFPEEIYFRGLLQERLGNTIKGTLVVSAFFSLMHSPQLILYGDIYSVMTFFPSVVMGLLYVATSNVLTSAIFHFFANVIFLGFQ